LEILGRESRQQLYIIAELKRQLKEATTALVVPSHVRPAPSTWEDFFPGAHSLRHSREAPMPSLACIRIVSPNRDCTCVRACAYAYSCVTCAAVSVSAQRVEGSVHTLVRSRTPCGGRS
jgi:hypothetical protein